MSHEQVPPGVANATSEATVPASQSQAPPQTETFGFQQTVDLIARAISTASQSHTSPQREFSFENIYKLGATAFFGITSPEEADAWLQKVDRVLTLMRCTDEDRVSCATFLLEKNAFYWWQSVLRKYPDPSSITWLDFKREFDEQYIRQNYRDAKQREFTILVQGSMTVAQYENKFIELSRFAPILVTDEKEKCKRFEYGLNDEIRIAVTAIEWTDFGKLVRAARRVESIISTQRYEKEQHRKRSGQSFYQGGSSERQPKRGSSFSQSQYSGSGSGSGSGNLQRDPRPPQSQFGLRSVQQSAGNSSGGQRWRPQGGSAMNAPRDRQYGYPQCRACGRFHEGECRKGSDGCYHCGQVGHLIRNCPALAQGGGNVERVDYQRAHSRGSSHVQAGSQTDCVRVGAGATASGDDSSNSSRQSG